MIDFQKNISILQNIIITYLLILEVEEKQVLVMDLNKLLMHMCKEMQNKILLQMLIF